MKKVTLIGLLVLIISSCQNQPTPQPSTNNPTTNGNGSTTNTNATCGATTVHNPAKTYGSVSDVCGNSYKTIVIGNQEWMAENLNTSKYSNGDPIPNLSDYSNYSGQWNTTSSGAWVNYSNNSQNECPYGKLYNFYTTVDSRNVCPTGWHVPSDNDWEVLENYLGGDSIAGMKLKSSGNKYWAVNTTATNESGFSALPGGWEMNIVMISLNYLGNWWTSSLDGNNKPIHRTIGNLDKYIQESTANQSRTNGISIRCIKN